MMVKILCVVAVVVVGVIVCALRVSGLESQAEETLDGYFEKID